MQYLDAKVYFDGSHYIAIPHTVKIVEDQLNHRDFGEFIRVPKQAKDLEDSEQEPSISACGELITRRDLFDRLYNQYNDCPYHVRKAAIVNEMSPYFDKPEYCEDFVTLNFHRKQRNMIVRRTRMCRKAYLAGFNYFCTFTYDDKKHTEDTFKQKLRTCFRHMTERKDWKYMGVWERAPESNRLHFHGLFNIPAGTLPGELTHVRDFDKNSMRMQDSMQNTYFNERFGRSDFKAIDHSENRLGNALAYLTKYIEKTGEKIVYSKNLPQYFISDIMQDDVVCTIGNEDKKLLLFDNFICRDEGKVIGEVNPEVIARMRKSD